MTLQYTSSCSEPSLPRAVRILLISWIWNDLELYKIYKTKPRNNEVYQRLGSTPTIPTHAPTTFALEASSLPKPHRRVDGLVGCDRGETTCVEELEMPLRFSCWLILYHMGMNASLYIYVD